MKPEQLSDFDRYTLLADKCKLPFGYEAYLKFKEVISFVKDMIGKQNDTFMHNGTIYNKKITSEAAKRFLDNLTRNRCDVFTLRLIGNQLLIRV